MNKLGETRKQIGVLSLGTNPDDPNQRVDFFIAPVETENGKSMEDGGSMDIVFATPEGFFAIRHSGTMEGKNAFVKLKADLLRMWGYWGDNKPHQFEGPSDGKFKTDGDSFKFLKDHNRGYSLNFAVPILYGGENKYTEGNVKYVSIPNIVPVGEETVSRAFEASSEKARELKMVDAQTGVRLHQTQEAARSLLDKMKDNSPQQQPPDL